MKKLILLSALYGVFFGINTMKAQDADTKKIFLDHGSFYKHPKRTQHNCIWWSKRLSRAHTDRNGDA